MPKDMFIYLIRKRRRAITEWCDQVPVLGFKCGRYDLNLIKEHFAELLADTTSKVQVAKKANTTMFMKTDHFLFLDIINYLGPGTSYEAWVKAYGCSTQKSWLPYEWFDTPEKLNYPGLPDYPEWHSKLKGGLVLNLSQFEECKKIFKERGMKTFADWLRYYNNLDVAPGLEALGENERFLQWKRNRHLERRRQPSRSQSPLFVARHDRARRRSLQPLQRSIWTC